MNLSHITNRFRFAGDPEQIVPFGCGHINDTYALTCRQVNGTTRRYILQKINRFVFKNPPALMKNIERVTAHLADKIRQSGGDPFRETLNLVHTLDGKTYAQDSTGDFWRVFHFIEGARTYETAENQHHIYQAAWAFGNFQRQLADFPVGQLYETIPNFHDTPGRFLAFMNAVQQDSHHRAASAKNEIQFLEQREADTQVLNLLAQQGLLPLRVTHNDTKFNNVMIDDLTGMGLCILDLDTVMPGLALFDFGDAVRSAAARIAEDAPDSSQAGISLETFDNLTHGYLDAARGFLTPTEIDYLAFSARLITLEQAIRFLGDYLNGDIYYKTSRPAHNLDRARTQIGMLQDMEKQFDWMNQIVSKYR